MIHVAAAPAGLTASCCRTLRPGCGPPPPHPPSASLRQVLCCAARSSNCCTSNTGSGSTRCSVATATVVPCPLACRSNPCTSIWQYTRCITHSDRRRWPMVADTCKEADSVLSQQTEGGLLAVRCEKCGAPEQMSWQRLLSHLMCKGMGASHQGCICYARTCGCAPAPGRGCGLLRG